MEKRMYFFVPYNISPIQQAIQAGHAALEYARKYGDTELFKDFIDNHKTWIILNGGTTNSSGKPESNYKTDEEPYLGSLNNIDHQLMMSDISYSVFNEPDLNDSLTAVCFIVDERVWNYEKYPDIIDYLDLQGLNTFRGTPIRKLKWTYKDFKEMFPKHFNNWIKNIMGNEKNVFLRELIKGKKLA